LSFFKEKNILLNSREKSMLRKFVIATSSIILSGVFFSYIDKIILGYFVQAEFIGYYAAAFSLISSSVILITFSTALLPVFSRLKKKELDDLYGKTIKMILLPSIILFLIFSVLASPITSIIYGDSYMDSVNILRLFSLLLIIMPIISLSTTYLIAIGKPLVISKVLIITTVIHIILNYVLISKMVVYGQLFGVYGAVIATLASNIICTALLMYYRSR
jgi:O-antigen/teichoic acid export membrane protein